MTSLNYRSLKSSKAHTPVWCKSKLNGIDTETPPLWYKNLGLTSHPTEIIEADALQITTVKRPRHAF